MTRCTPHLIAVAFRITACNASISAQPETLAERRAKEGDVKAQADFGITCNGRGAPQNVADWCKFSHPNQIYLKKKVAHLVGLFCFACFVPMFHTSLVVLAGTEDI